MSNLSSVERPGSSCAWRVFAFLLVRFGRFRCSMPVGRCSPFCFSPQICQCWGTWSILRFAAAYNAAHTTVVHGPLAAYGYLSSSPVALAVGLIGLTHVGFDRLLG